MPPLGLFAAMEDSGEGWVELPDAARLYLYSDGLVEPSNSAGEMFGATRLIQLLNKAEVLENDLEAVIKQVMAFSDDGKHVDDVTLVEMHK